MFSAATKTTAITTLSSTVAIFSTSFFCIIVFARAHTAAPIWPANAILLAVLLRHSQKSGNYKLLLFGGALALMLAELSARHDPVLAASLTFANLAEVMAAFWLLRRLHQGSSYVSDVRGLCIFLVVASGFAPSVSASIATVALNSVNPAHWQEIWATWYAADALGMAIVGPFSLSLNAAHWQALRSYKNKMEMVALIVSMPIIVLAAAYYRIALFLVVPIVILSTFRFGVLGAGLTTLLIATIGTTLIIMGVGAPVLSHVDMPQRIIGLQLLLAANVIWAFPVAALVSANKKMLAKVASDNSYLKSASDQKSQMLDVLRQRMTNSEEKERLRIARELHDETGQSIAAAMMEAKQLENFIREAGRQHITALMLTLEEIGKTLHRIAWQLRPTSIDDCGLVGALENYVADWSDRFGLEVDFYCNDELVEKISHQTRIAIYRLIQEGLANVSKHAAEANVVSIVIERIGRVLHLSIEDNGRGFDAERVFDESTMNGSGGLGLIGMRERVSLLGGELEIESSAGRGTTIFARIPVDNRQVAA